MGKEFCWGRGTIRTAIYTMGSGRRIAETAGESMRISNSHINMLVFGSKIKRMGTGNKRPKLTLMKEIF